jgi:hypothetical protein
MAPEDVRKFSLITKYGLYDLTIMPFGMKNTTSTFTHTFGAYMDLFFKVFVDDFNIRSMTWDEHLEHICYILMMLKEVNLKLNPNKCELAKINICILGHIISRKNTQLDQRKVKAVIKISVSVLITNVHGFF